MTFETVAVVVPAHAATMEAEAVRADRVARVLRGRPVVAVVAGAAQRVVPAVARSGQEYRTAIGSCELSTVYSIDISPFAGAV